jgi:moderate conductance mechanosensitive channel
MNLLMKFIEQTNWEKLISSGLRLLLTLILLWIAVTIVKVLLRRLEQRLIALAETRGEVPTEAKKRAETLVRLLRQGVLILVWVIGTLVALREVGLEIGPILASVGVAGLAIGFGAQNLVKDVISGFFLILENQVRVGDVAVVNGTGGLVEQVNFRTIVLRDLEGTVHVFPNGNIETLSNLTQVWSAFVFDIGVAYKEDVDEVIPIMRRVGAEMRADPYFGPLIIEDIEIFGVDQFADSAVVIKGRIKTQPIKQWEVGREYRRRLKRAFDDAGVEIPFPHRTLYLGDQPDSPLVKLATGAAAARLAPRPD